MLLFIMPDAVGGDIGICFKEEKEHQHRHCRRNPGDHEGKYHNAPEDYSEVHRDNPPVRGKELFVDIPGSLLPYMAVGDMRVEVVGKEEPAGKPEVGIGKVHVSKEPRIHDEGKIAPVEESVMEGEETGKHVRIDPGKTGGDFLRPAPLVNRFLEIRCKSRRIGT